MHYPKKFFKFLGQIFVFGFALLPILIIFRVLIALLLIPLGILYTELLDIPPDSIIMPLFWAVQGAGIMAMIFHIPEKFKWQFAIAAVIACIASLGFGPMN